MNLRNINNLFHKRPFSHTKLRISVRWESQIKHWGTGINFGSDYWSSKNIEIESSTYTLFKNNFFTN